MSITKNRIERKEKVLYYVVIFSFLIFLFQRIFLGVFILNYPSKVFFLSVLGLTFLTVYFTRNRFLFLGFTSIDKLKNKTLILIINSFKYFVSFLLIYIFILSTGLNIYVRYFSKSSTVEYLTIPISQINKGNAKSAPSIGFYFKNEYNTLSHDPKIAKILEATKDRFHPNCILRITYRKSILNCYLVEVYDIY